MLKFEQHLGLLIGAIFLCLLFALYIYYKDERFKNNNVYVKACIVFLRFLSLCIIAILLFKPKWLLKTKQIEKPIIIFLQDASSSILNYSDSTFYKSKLPDIILDNNKKLSENLTSTVITFQKMYLKELQMYLMENQQIYQMDLNI